MIHSAGKVGLATPELNNIEMKRAYLIVCIILSLLISCRSTKHINQVIAPKDSTLNVRDEVKDSALMQLNKDLLEFKKHYIDFNTFSAKIKADVETSKEKLPDLTAVVRIQKDKAIWMSVSATFLNIEVYRVYITPDSVILLNKKDKEVQYRSLDYLQEVTQIPFDFKTLQDMIIGNAIFYEDKVQSSRRVDNFILLSTIGKYFKHLLTLADDSKLLVRSKLDDVDMTRNRTADISYSDYESIEGFQFSTARGIIISEKNKIDMNLKFRQVEFNKELSMTFNIPKNYTQK